MKKYCLYIIFIFISQNLKSQTFGKITYKESKEPPIIFNSKVNNTEDAEINEDIKKASSELFELIFSKDTSTYNQFQSLEITPKKIKIYNLSGGISKLYKNMINYINQVEFLGETFLIKDRLTIYDWKLTKETKNIKGYKCKKAVAIDEYVGSDGNRYQKRIIAYFTEDIKSNQGPNFLFGLSGLILEGSIGNLNITCEEINLDYKKPIRKPNKGKIINYKDYKKTVSDRIKKKINN